MNDATRNSLLRQALKRLEEHNGIFGIPPDSTINLVLSRLEDQATILKDLEWERDSLKARIVELVEALEELVSEFEDVIHSEFETRKDREPWTKFDAWKKAVAALAQAKAGGA